MGTVYDGMPEQVHDDGVRHFYHAQRAHFLAGVRAKLHLPDPMSRRFSGRVHFMTDERYRVTFPAEENLGIVEFVCISQWQQTADPLPLT